MHLVTLPKEQQDLSYSIDILPFTDILFITSESIKVTVSDTMKVEDSDRFMFDLWKIGQAFTNQRKFFLKKNEPF